VSGAIHDLIPSLDEPEIGAKLAIGFSSNYCEITFNVNWLGDI